MSEQEGFEKWIEWNEIQPSIVDTLAKQILDNLGDILIQTETLIPFTVSISEETKYTLYISRVLAQNDTLIAGLRNEVRIATTLRRSIYSFKEELAVGGLARFQPSYEITLEKKQQELAESIAMILEQLSALSPKVTIRQVTSDKTEANVQQKTNTEERINRAIDEHINSVIHITGSNVNIGPSKQEVKNMSGTNVQVGDGNVFHGDFITANKIKDSFKTVEMSNKSEDVKKLLKNLTAEVGKMCEGLPEEKAEQVADDLQTLTKEATKEKPRKKWWELSVEGIKEAAESVGEIGKTTLLLLTDLVPFLENMS